MNNPRLQRQAGYRLANALENLESRDARLETLILLLRRGNIGEAKSFYQTAPHRYAPAVRALCLEHMEWTDA